MPNLYSFLLTYFGWSIFLGSFIFLIIFLVAFSPFIELELSSNIMGSWDACQGWQHVLTTDLLFYILIIYFF